MNKEKFNELFSEVIPWKGVSEQLMDKLASFFEENF